jgi:hypothetical protein
MPQRRFQLRWTLPAGLLLAVASGCASGKTHAPNLAARLAPSNQRVWSPDQALLPTAEIGPREVLVHNVRNCRYESADEYIVDYYDKLVPLDELDSVDFIVVPFKDMPSMAHTMLSFGMRDGERLAVSVEVRKEQGESYSVVQGMLNQFEIMYVVADERDVIDLRAVHRGDDVYAYPMRATPPQVRRLFVDMMYRANQLAERPEFYHTVANNCTTAIVHHFNQLSDRQLPLYDLRILLPGYSDQLAYNLGLIDTNLPFAEARRRANVSPLARAHREDPKYSVAIRGGATQSVTAIAASNEGPAAR